MLLRLVTLVVAQGLDLASFQVMVDRHGLEAEGNPLVAQLFQTLGMPGVAGLKVALVVFVGALAVAAWANRGNRTWAFIGGAPLAVGIVVGIIGGITNAASYLG